MGGFVCRKMKFTLLSLWCTCWSCGHEIQYIYPSLRCNNARVRCNIWLQYTTFLVCFESILCNWLSTFRFATLRILSFPIESETKSKSIDLTLNNLQSIDFFFLGFYFPHLWCVHSIECRARCFYAKCDFGVCHKLNLLNIRRYASLFSLLFASSVTLSKYRPIWIFWI